MSGWRVEPPINKINDGGQMHIVVFKPMIGRILTSVMGAEKNSERIDFECAGGGRYLMHHVQDCCEYVSVYDVAGDVSDLVGSPINMFEAVSKNDPDASESGTWTFYRIGTTKGSVTIRWYGSSNGYYSERVDFDVIREPVPRLSIDHASKSEAMMAELNAARDAAKRERAG